MLCYKFLLLISLFFYSCDGSENVQIIDSQANLPTSPVGSKRKFEELYEASDNQAKYDLLLGSLKRALVHFNPFVVSDYVNEPWVNFFDKLIRRSFDLKLENEPSERELWELPCTLTIDWSLHLDAFFFILFSKSKFTEDVILEYFQFLMNNWRNGAKEGTKLFYLWEVCNVAIEKQFLNLFEEILRVLMIEEPDKLYVSLIIFKKLASQIEEPSDVKFQLMCGKVLKGPTNVYDPRLRIPNFKGTNSVNRSVFIHFLPILKCLLTDNEVGFVADQEAFDLFVLFRMGDLEEKVPIGMGALRIVNQMFLRSHINLSAFKEDLNALRKEIIERLFDALFLDFGTVELAKFLFDSGNFSIFESFLKYSKNLNWNAGQIYEILSHFLKSDPDYSETNYIQAMITYVNIPITVWETLKEKFENDVKKVSIAILYQKIQETLSNFSLNQNLNLKEGGSVEIEVKSIEKIEEMADKIRRPVTLEVARVFLARICGIPLEMTEILEICNEGFEWIEAIGFINFYLERSAGIVNYTGDILRFAHGLTPL